ncbi:hypothetical protein H0H93_009633 [Arthromyces matolae]|nr:hypothetical protein H0H93_009633 [Arthromyces matolae]
MIHTNETWSQLIDLKIQEIMSLPQVVPPNPPSISREIIASTIDHTLLKPDATPGQIDALCDEAQKYNFKAQEHLNLKLCMVFTPFYNKYDTQDLFSEAKVAIEEGAKEIDMVLNIGALKSRNYELVYNDIAAVISSASDYPVKVILETVFLTDEEKIAASFIAAEAGASFVKTCTGFLGGGASISDVVLLKKTVEYKGNVFVKASAGIRSLKSCVEMLQAGADRIGTSSGVAIMENIEGSAAY